MQVIIGIMPQFQPKDKNTNLSSLFAILESFCGEEESSTHSNTNKLGMQYAILKRVAVFYFKNTLKQK